ncbi:P-loop containing nucleoside triphosphate hydrolase [Pseudocohnilembus persalinus]|uniref:p-loop containing nucleoside triphosphate hydrolase n=1 Tax=Pseudocohnilembus persalinus TaxID=266149 RepID=A0A0V0Q7R5_PSEPJ|nr:P-loop containing nucleoside triphosphate hydrolase [Pseudocohnilembus persalinus]|eukprot:KRW98087.1 P-loop containing nucleoside triphosphate hydrolase [Pseudocohnilembus persalinus]
MELKLDLGQGFYSFLWPYNIGDVLTVFFAIMIGGMNIGQATPCLEKFSLGQTAAYKVLKVIDNQPKISPSLHKGETIKNLKGEISFNDVEFTYPTKQDVQVLKKINFKIQPGKKTALVGESGCGKSTCMQLVERFYDADKGSVTVDGVDIKKLNLAWYRENVGYVGQEPVLFAGSIRENLRYGKPDATEEEMIQALKHARAWDFVNLMSDKLDTLVGNSGGQLSGGQKQRICIARAILKAPPILLLDEATSALDRQNEQSIQKTLDEVSAGRTTLVIAHRLSTVKNSDEIIVIDQGKVIERGTHDYLVSLGGKYAALTLRGRWSLRRRGRKRQLLR